MFLLASGFYIINCISRWIKKKSNHFSQREGFTSDCCNSDEDCKRGKNVASIAITTSSTTVIVKTKIQSLISKVKPIYYLTKINRILQVNQCGQSEEEKQKSWKISLATDKNQDVFSWERLFAKPTLVYSQLTISDKVTKEAS